MALQWSHDLSAMDTVNSLPGLASVVSLQWSHDLSAMDTASAGTEAHSYIWLQWSHDLSAMDTALVTRTMTILPLASMEP